MLVRIISMVIAGVIIVYLVRCFPLQPMLTKCGHFLILKQENRKSFF